MKIRQSVTFNAPPHEVYEALMDSKKHEAFTRDKAHISRKPGGTFTAYGGYITGKNLELYEDEKIVQLWRTDEWPEGHFSTVTYRLKDLHGSTKLTFTQDGIPEEFCESIRKGWHEYYWRPLKKLLEGR
ncbi:MAG: SRPBCC family protein [Candidatus Eremiobacteraeota bacterium]|nr:SRPBCC family protein [Candidatus Eremiobacteraeota bacterium]